MYILVHILGPEVNFEIAMYYFQWSAEYIF